MNTDNLVKNIPLTRNKFSLIDSQDFEWLNQWKWHCTTLGYAARHTRKNGKNLQIWMHRLINNTPKGLFTDHINRTKLDNRRSNLRTVTANENQMNREAPKHNTSGIKGIYRHDDKWQAGICINGKTIYLGVYSDIKRAYLARAEAERFYYGS